MTRRAERPLLLGIDVGSTVTKAVVYASNGAECGRGEVRSTTIDAGPGRFEREMEMVWIDASRAIARAIAAAGGSPEDVGAVGVSGHGDGLFLLDEMGRPIRPAILPLDRRASSIVAEWEASGVAEAALYATGQWPWAGSTATLLRWLKVHERGSAARVRAVLSCKDWVRFRLTGVLATDRTEAGSSLSGVRTLGAEPRALHLLGIEEFGGAMPPVVEPCAQAGWITAEAARVTGVAEGTPVVTGLHDIAACAVGAGSIDAGVMTVIAGSFGVNAVVAERPILDRRWGCRSHVHPGTWGHSARSAGAAGSIDWFVRTLYSHDDPSVIDGELAATSNVGGGLRYVPPSAGSILAGQPSPELLRLCDAVGRRAILGAVLDGLVQGHLARITAMRAEIPISEVRLTGGASRNRWFRRRFADASDLPISAAYAPESGALGAAICAAVGIGVFGDLETGMQAMAGTPTRIEPASDPSAARCAHVRGSISPGGPATSESEADGIGWLVGPRGRVAVNNSPA